MQQLQDVMDTNPKTERISTLLAVLHGKIDRRVISECFEVEYAPCGYRESDALPDENFPWKKFDGVWGGDKNDSHYWFRFVVDVPRETGDYRLNFETADNQWKWDDCDNPQMLVYVDGQARQALDWNHRFVDLSGGAHQIFIYAYTGMWVNEVWADKTRSFLLRMRLTQIDKDAQGLYYDIKVPFESALAQPEDSFDRERILTALNKALNLLDVREECANFSASVKAVRAYMAEEFYGKLCQKSEIRAILTGHAHIDIAWLWPARQSREKAERTFSTMTYLMEKYPDLHFFASSPVLYKWLKTHNPKLYASIKEKIREGRWEADCGAWVEADMNIPSGESFVRQFLYGKRFLKEEFDIESKTLWLPDCFGFSGSLPQIMRGCGIEQLVTNKLTWNDTNKMPHDVFIWRGIDGSDVYAYFMTAQDVPLSDGKGNRKSYTTYSSTATPSQVKGAWEGFREKEITQNVHIAFGFGDGGGGPNEEQIEYVYRMEHGIPGIPTTKMGGVEAFLSAVRDDMTENKAVCPKWDGELYFEFHRGVYTTVGKNKYNNRKAEFGMHDAEWLSVAAKTWAGTEYPRQALDECWEKLLEYQFHDIIPGTSIREVYDETDKGYAEIFDFAERTKIASRKALAKKLPLGRKTVWNSTPFEQSSWIRDGQVCVQVENVPAYGYKVVSDFGTIESVYADENTLENTLLRITFDEKKRIIGIYDKRAERELLPRGKVANRLMVYDDMPTYFDAWELRKHYREKGYEIDDLSGFERVQDGCRSGFKIVRKYYSSTIEQTVWLYANSTEIEFETEIDWHCHKTLLKTEFPLEINTTRAICDIPFGSIERAVTQNTSWEQAKFEVCAHKYADLSEGDYGVALMNDCKYGYSFTERQMELSLLRTPTHPYPEADIGKQKVRYMLYPHRNNFYTSDVVQKAYVFNNPLTLQETERGDGSLPSSHSFMRCSQRNIAIDTIKESEDGDCIVLRAYEFANTQTKAEIVFGFAAEKAILCDMLERDKQEIVCENGKIVLTFKPFEIITCKVYKKPD